MRQSTAHYLWRTAMFVSSGRTPQTDASSSVGLRPAVRLSNRRHVVVLGPMSWTPCYEATLKARCGSTGALRVSRAKSSFRRVSAVDALIAFMPTTAQAQATKAAQRAGSEDAKRSD